MRNDIELEKYAKEKGWSVRRHFSDIEVKVPNFALQFYKGDKWIWLCSMGWCCADIVAGSQHYANHRYENDLKTVIDKES